MEAKIIQNLELVDARIDSFLKLLAKRLRHRIGSCSTQRGQLNSLMDALTDCITDGQFQVASRRAEKHRVERIKDRCSKLRSALSDLA
jgi:hypothetical protein